MIGQSASLISARRCSVRRCPFTRKETYLCQKSNPNEPTPKKYLTDLNASDIEVDFGEYTDTTYPDAVVGKPYRIFPASLPISYTQTKSFVNVYTGYETNLKTDVNIVNGCFTPRWVTEHTIEYSYVDTFGNKKIKTVVVNAKAESEQIQMAIDQTPISLEVGQYIHLPAMPHNRCHGKILRILPGRCPQ